jgi:hypothetical protein
MMKRWYLPIVILLASWCISANALARYQQQLDDGTSVTVDNASGWSEAVIANLVLSADRSTRDGCPYSYGTKGLFKTGDRIFVNQNYLAWFDYTSNDGYTRSGELAGFWSVNPSTQLFKYYRQAPGGCWNWPANELIPGSASGDGGGPYWWDKYAPAFEHTVGIHTLSVPGHDMFLSSVYAQQTSTSQFQTLVDGTEDGAGVHYKTQFKLVAADFGGYPFAVDIADGNDVPNSGYYILAKNEYMCRSNDILSVFDFSPNTNVTSNNIYGAFWVAYAQNEDNTACDVGAGVQWPPTTSETLPPRYVQSSSTLTAGWDGATYTPNTITQLQVPSSGCGANNYGVNALHSTGLPVGTWLRAFSSPTGDVSQPRWQVILLDSPGAGDGSSINPYRVPITLFGFWNETHDGTVGLGYFHGTGNEYPLVASKWYRLYVSISTNF